MIQIQKGALAMLNELLCDPLGTLEKQNVVICALTRHSKQVRGLSQTTLTKQGTLTVIQID